MPDPTPLRVAVVGAGAFGRNHLRVYSELEGATLCAVIDHDAATAAEAGQKYGIPHFSSVEALLAADLHLNAASICVPTIHHLAAARPLLEAGLDVLIEKPLAPSLADADALIALAARHGCLIQTGHLERFNPAVTAARELLNRPMFFEAHRMSVFTPRSLDVDVVLDLMIHDLDIVLSLNPGPVEEVRAAGVAVVSSSIDIANARIQFKSGCVANLTSSRVSTNKMRRLRLFQRNNYLSIDFQTRQGMICRRNSTDGERPTVEVEQLQGGDEEPLKLQLESFLHAAGTGARPLVSGEDGAAAVDVAHQVLQAIAAFAVRHTPSPEP